MNKSEHSLQSWHIVILRPPSRGEGLAQSLRSLGAQPIFLPTIEILPLTFSQEQIKSWQGKIKRADYLFVASQNAVNCLPFEILESLVNQQQIRIITMGEETSKALIQKNISVFYTPPCGTTSESLLVLPFLQTKHIQDKKGILLAGMGGRTLLGETLTKRGVHIEWLTVYRQKKPDIDFSVMIASMVNQEKYCFVAMSENALGNLFHSVTSNQQAWLKNCPLIVISDRLADKAKTWGFQAISVSHGATPMSIISALKKLDG